MQKPRLSFWQIFNMSFGFLGIQFGWGLQLANMSGIYTYLGAKPEQVPILWLAGPVTGLLVQPIIGSMSDRTWNRLGRRPPDFLTVAFLVCVLWTVITTKEFPPENMAEFERKRKERKGIGATVAEVASALREMPITMKQLAVVQFFTWLGLFCMWMFFGLMTSYHVFGATNERDPRFTDGQAWGGNAFAVYSITCFAVAFLLPPLARATSRKKVHAIALVCGALGLLSVFFIHDKGILLLTMIGVGIAWASILAMPYAILSGAIPGERMGVYMGIFNFFIVIPEIIASFAFGPVIRAIFGPDNPKSPMYVVMAGRGLLAPATG